MEAEMELALQAYVEQIKRSGEYIRYAAERDKVKQFPDLKAQIDAYRMENFELQNSPETAIEEIERFEKEYAGFRENPLVADFLAAELAFCRMMQEINSRVMAQLDFE